MLRSVMLFLLALLSVLDCRMGAAQTVSIYRCPNPSAAGSIVFSDTPCAPGQAPLPAQQPNGMSPSSPGSAAQARAFDARIAKEQTERDHADAIWLKRYTAQQQDAERIRKAIMENRVVQGMTPDQVKQILNEPTRIEQVNGGERWIYQNGRSRRTIVFKNGVVASDASSTARR